MHIIRDIFARCRHSVNTDTALARIAIQKRQVANTITIQSYFLERARCSIA
jgi:hypothetical protein